VTVLQEIVLSGADAVSDTAILLALEDAAIMLETGVLLDADADDEDTVDDRYAGVGDIEDVVGDAEDETDDSAEVGDDVTEGGLPVKPHCLDIVSHMCLLWPNH
jgi:hypothetical protein